MSMSLTISQPSKTEFGRNAFAHDFNPSIFIAKSRFPPKTRVGSPCPVSSLPASTTTSANNKMSTHPHRGLPPPSAMALPDPRRDGHPPSQPLGAMPAPPNQWQGQEDAMRNWLLAKAEEDKRKQEEERTQQEMLKLERRKIEQLILRESLAGGVPPPMIPMIYAGIDGGNLANVSLEWLQQYASQLHATQQQQLQHPSPDMRRDQGRHITAPPHVYPINPSAQQQQQVLPSQSTEQTHHTASLGPLQTTFSAYMPTARQLQQHTSAPRSATHTQLPKLTTNEMYVQGPPQPGASNAHALQQSLANQQQEAPTSSPSIYFHHWVPPGEAKSGLPQTPASKGEPHSAHGSASLRDTDYRESPRKRKAQGGHEANPPPLGGPQYTSPPFSTSSSTSGRKGGHVRSRSIASAGRESDSRPESRDPLSMSQVRQPDSGNTNISTASVNTDDSVPRPLLSRLHDAVPRSLTEAIPRDTRLERSRPGSR